MFFIFWSLIFMVGVAGLLFPYFGYPVVLKLMKARVRSSERDKVPLPSLSVVIPVYNGAALIGAKIENLLTQNYPGKLEIIVASDASDDGTDDIVKSYEPKGVRLLRIAERGGKSAAQNAALAEATGDVFVFTDATVLLEPGALTALAEEFADPTVGCVSGTDRSTGADSQDASEGAGLYTRFEIALRKTEAAKTGTLIGVSGCLFAVRKHLRPQVPPDAVDDLYVPLFVAAAGYRTVAKDEAVAVVKRTANLSQEFGRKVRTITGALFTMKEALRNMPPAAVARIRMQLFAHKLMRWLGPLFALAALVANIFLAGDCAVFLVLLVGQVLIYFSGLAGVILDNKFFAGTPIRKLMNLGSFFLVTQAASAVSWWRFLRKKPFIVWQPTKR